MKIKTHVKPGDEGGYESDQHSQTITRALKVKTNVKAGIYVNPQHNRTMARGLKVKTGIKAGPPDTPTVRD